MNRLKELREEKGISQKRLAVMLNVSQATISKYEISLAQPDIHTLILLADCFKVSVDYLIGHSELKTNFNQSTLNGQETELLSDFKRLNKVQQGKVMAYIKGLLQE